VSDTILFPEPRVVKEPDTSDRIVGDGGVVIVTEETQRLFASMLIRLTEMALEAANAGGSDGFAAFHGAMQYLSASPLPPQVLARAKELSAWAKHNGIVSL